jgi:hypothetical protein
VLLDGGKPGVDDVEPSAVHLLRIGDLQRRVYYLAEQFALRLAFGFQLGDAGGVRA